MVALALGAATWFAATYLIDISGANRELTEGVTALLAAAVLVGTCMIVATALPLLRKGAW